MSLVSDLLGGISQQGIRGSVTPLERAEKIVHGPARTQVEIIAAIHAAIVEATSDEVEKRRSLERELANARAGGPTGYLRAESN